jgi:hypothetical protein
MSGTVYPSGPQLLRIPATILLPSAATPFNPGAVNPSVEQCWDSIKALELYGIFNSLFGATQPPSYTAGTHINNGNHYFGSNANCVFVGNRAIEFASPTTRTYTRPVTEFASRNPDSWWFALEQEIASANLRVQYKQRYSPLSPAEPWLMWLFRMPAYSVLTGVEVYITPASAAAHGGVLPAQQPILKLWSSSHVTGLSTEIDEVQDNQPDAATYALSHKLELTGLTSPAVGTWDTSRSLLIGVRGEEGVGGVGADPNYGDAGLLVNQPIVHFTRTRLGEE